jgi:hypothetical protein
MKERPILFADEMVSAIMAGRKSQTRRVIKNLLGFGAITEFGRTDTPGYDWHFRDREMRWHDHRHDRLLECCKYGEIGDHLWVREVWRTVDGCSCEEACHIPGNVYYDADGGGNDRYSMNKKRSPMFMPRWASRIVLEITNIRAERVQDIRDKDVFAEGIQSVVDNGQIDDGTARGAFKTLWDSINSDRGFGWDENPWVWVIEFNKI